MEGRWAGGEGWRCEGLEVRAGGEGWRGGGAQALAATRHAQSSSIQGPNEGFHVCTKTSILLDGLASITCARRVSCAKRTTTLSPLSAPTQLGGSSRLPTLPTMSSATRIDGAGCSHGHELGAPLSNGCRKSPPALALSFACCALRDSTLSCPAGSDRELSSAAGPALVPPPAMRPMYKAWRLRFVSALLRRTLVKLTCMPAGILYVSKPPTSVMSFLTSQLRYHEQSPEGRIRAS